MEHHNITKIAVFKFRNIGDVLMTTPALRALRESFPHAHITMVVNSVTDPMVTGNPDVNEVIVYERERKQESWLSCLRYELKFARELRKRRFNLTIDFTSGDRPIWYALFSGAQYRVGFRNYRWAPWNWRRYAFTRSYLLPDGDRHEVERHLWLLDQMGIPASKDKSLCLKISDSEQKWVDDFLNKKELKKIVHVHPVSRWLFKCWDDQRMAQVIDWLQKEKGYGVVVTSSDEGKELDRARKIVSSCKTYPVFLEGGISLKQLAALSKRAACFLGVDTAPMHIAAAVGTPVVALFGPSSAVHWHPWSEKQISLNEPCPCRIQGGQQCDWNQVRQCMQSITVEQVRTALEQFV